MIRVIKRLFVYIGNCCPPPFNFFFYKIAGIKLGPGKIWIGNRCNFDTQFPENITILGNVCISFGVTFVTHFDPSEGINNHKINKYKKDIIIKSGSFIGPNSIILPGVVIEENCLIKAGSVVEKTIPKNSIIEGNPCKIIGQVNEKNINLINNANKNFRF